VSYAQRFSLATAAALCASVSALSSATVAQQSAAPRAAAAAPAPRTASRATARPKYRQLAPGVMKLVAPETQVAESFSRHDMIEVLSADPTYVERDWSKGKSPARDVVYRRDIWALEFAFKPVRFVHVDVPLRDGRLRPKLVWYLEYSLKNPSDKPVNFVPRFVLVSKDRGKIYPDRLIPVAVPLIRKREDPNRPLLNTIEITGKIPPAPKGAEPSIWGVATWEDIDPRTDHFAIYIQGLTNAFLWVDPPGAYKNGDAPGTGREYFAKTLILNFWRPSDPELEHEEEIRFEDYKWEYGQLTEKGFVAKTPDPTPKTQPSVDGGEQPAEEGAEQPADQVQ
jgi:hypothetical protein